QSTLQNDGTFRITGGTQPATVNITLANSNTGLIDVKAGTLVLQAGGTLGGSIQSAAGTTLQLSSGSDTVPAGASLSVPTVQCPGATVDGRGTDAAAATVLNAGKVPFESSTTLNSLAVSGGILETAGDLTVTGLLSWSGGTMSAPAGATPAPR